MKAKDNFEQSKIYLNEITEIILKIKKNLVEKKVNIGTEDKYNHTVLGLKCEHEEFKKIASEIGD